VESRLTFTQAQWDLVLASFVVALFALLATSVHQLTTRSEISARYRPATVAGGIVSLVAALSYATLALSWITGFDFDAASRTYSASEAALQFRNGYRYVDWTITVPLLCVELVGVSLLVGERAKRFRAAVVPLAVVMIVTGYLGESVLGRPGEPDQDLAQFVTWGLVSTAAFVPLYVLLLREGLRSGARLPHPAGAHLRNAAFVLSFAWGVYPLAYLVPLFFPDSPDWAVGRQIAFTLADITAKVGYGLLIHATAKARTAMDVAAGESPHPEPVYVDGEEVAAARPVVRADGRADHRPDGGGTDVRTGT
jgi:bacteriorhodopsin